MSTIKTPASPKVLSGGTWAAFATMALALANSITQDSLSFLGPWAPLVYGLIIGLSYALGAYLKEDPLRTEGAIAVEAKKVPVAQLAAAPTAPVDPGAPAGSALPAPPPAATPGA
jgi:hypothetical protein